MAHPVRIITPDMPDDALVSIAEACAFLGVCRQTFYTMLNDGDITRVILSARVVRLRVGDLRRLATPSDEAGAA